MKLIGTFLLAAVLAPAAFALGCESVKDLKLAHVTITMAEPVAAGSFQPGGRGGAAFASLPEFCRVAATLTPVADSEIKIEVWLPARNWNGALQSVGNGAWAGTISYPAMATALAAGYAAASTDTGHSNGNTADFIPGHPEKVIDFAYRAVHEMTVAAKQIIAADYGRAPLHSYFNGCSTGGRQALTEAQRYPEDYDGIIAGAPANWTTRLQGQQIWTTQVVTRDPASMIPQTKYAAIHAAALAACDARDGVQDGVIESPLACNFDPATIQCQATDAEDCLTAPQVAAVRQTYRGPTDTTGSVLFPGLEPGSEMGWSTLSGARPMSYAEEIYKYLVFNDMNWSYLDFQPARDMATASQRIGGMMDAIDPDLTPFFSRGGRLLMYHGWNDPGIAPRNSVNYYEDVVETVGADRAGGWTKLYMVPGMNHCGGGDGTATFDLMTPLQRWVEGGVVPQSIPASRTRGGQTDRTRPLCPFPQVAKYDGSGSIDEASNFACVAP